MPLPFETPHLILRPFEEQDIPAFALYRSDPEVARYQGWETPYTIKQAAGLIHEMQSIQPGSQGGWYQIAMTLKSTGELIGDCAFNIQQPDRRQAEIGITLARVFQGQGYGTEAVEQLLVYLFEELQLHRVRANCDSENVASARLIKKAGMRHEGHFVESYWSKDTWTDEDWYAILQREWFERHSALSKSDNSVT